MRIGGEQFTAALATLAVLMLINAAPGAAQARRRSQEDLAKGASLALSTNVGGKRVTASGPGRCARETNASLYGKAAALYLVQYSGTGELTAVHLTLWEFKDGSPSQLGITVDVGGASHRVSTLQGGKRQGDGTATVQAAGTGGRIVVHGRDARGTSLEVTIECESFQGIEAEGG